MSHSSHPPPRFRELSHDECAALLRRQHVGRLAYALHDRVWIEPIHYTYDDGWLVGRTSAGSKLATLAHNPWVALETDEIRDTFDWESVVVRGTFYRLKPHGNTVDRASYARALPLLRAIVPESLGPDDPVAFRDVLFHIHVDEMTGRAAAPPNAETDGEPASG
ncbi:Pyridoxamine 5'-phosphate oxidase-related protein (plasmid) [Gemmatirosa kalamazoonensis]|uniref:Pyridoxamine 5'-phosphate oxidase-related protein n=1 Tax=Gemmatirosa kalamazoonensis TaxID=861299 RepID=W0RNJ4_9BACT|nr:pyridoxamine 5'-phosphate oxidase family protein [Gemmatirosa kalamazoonensis]AHG92584.1 Pyridoxamine 5'-phosphate oxidase-related protein [Gemmatirosa kalamazoonensis]